MDVVECLPKSVRHALAEVHRCIQPWMAAKLTAVQGEACPAALLGEAVLDTKSTMSANPSALIPLRDTTAAVAQVELLPSDEPVMLTSHPHTYSNQTATRVKPLLSAEAAHPANPCTLKRQRKAGTEVKQLQNTQVLSQQSHEHWRHRPLLAPE